MDSLGCLASAAFVQSETEENTGRACRDKAACPPVPPPGLAPGDAAGQSVAWRIQQEVLHDCALLLPSSSNPVAALSVGDSHGL